MAYYARKCHADGDDICGGDNCLWLDGRLSLRTMRSRAAEWARQDNRAAGYNIYRTLRDTQPLWRNVFIRVKPPVFTCNECGRVYSEGPARCTSDDCPSVEKA